MITLLLKTELEGTDAPSYCFAAKMVQTQWGSGNPKPHTKPIRGSTMTVPVL